MTPLSNPAPPERAKAAGVGAEERLCVQGPPSKQEHPPGRGAQVALQKVVTYTGQSHSSSRPLPTRKQGPVVTNGPHAHGTAAPRHPALSCTPRELIHRLLAAPVGADKSSLLQSPLQGHRSEEGEDRLESLNFVFYWDRWQHEAADPSPWERHGFRSVPTAHLASEGATSPQPLQS